MANSSAATIKTLKHKTEMDSMPTSSSRIEAIKEDGVVIYRSTDVSVADGWHVPRVDSVAPQWQTATHNTTLRTSQYSRFQNFLVFRFYSILNRKFLKMTTIIIDL